MKKMNAVAYAERICSSVDDCGDCPFSALNHGQECLLLNEHLVYRMWEFVELSSKLQNERYLENKDGN